MIACVLVAVAVTGIVYGQQDRLQALRNNFRSADLATKLDILRTAEAQDPVAFAPLYLDALSFVVDNAASLPRQAMLREVGLNTIERLETGSVSAAAFNLWRLFQSYDETAFRVRVARTLGALAADNERIIDGMSEWMRAQSNLLRAGEQVRVDMQVANAIVVALGRIGSQSSFEPLLDAALVGYPTIVAAPIAEVIAAIGRDSADLATEAVLARRIDQRLPAYRYLKDLGYLSTDQALEFGRRILGPAVAGRPKDVTAQRQLRELRYAIVNDLSAGGYGNATREVIRHFNDAVLDFDRGRTGKTPVLEAIAALGSMGTEAAALRLTEYLELLNTYTELDRSSDTQITLATITNLERLANSAAYNALLVASLLENYSGQIRAAAERALSSLER